MSLYAQMEKNAQFQADLQKYEEQADFLFRKQRLERIEQFTDQFEFLANEFPCNVYYEGLIYNSVYAAFQAARTQEAEMRQRIQQSQSIQEVYQIAQHIDDPPDWSTNRVEVMEKLLRDKFRRNKDLREHLRATNNYKLINTYKNPTTSNLYWGEIDNKGQNKLGRLLEQIRSDINAYEDIDKWIISAFPLETEYLPLITLTTYKDSENLGKIELRNQAYYFIGQYNKNYLVLQHPTVSRRHAAIFTNESSQTFVIDLGSSGGTFVNDQFIEPHQPIMLANDDKIRFAKSTRSYQININHDECYSKLKDKIDLLKNDIERLKNISTINQKKDDKNKKKVKQEEDSFHDYDTIKVKQLPERVSNLELIEMINKCTEKFQKWQDRTVGGNKERGHKQYRFHIKDLKIPLDRQTGNTKNIAFIIFQYAGQAQGLFKFYKDNRKEFFLRDKQLEFEICDQKSVEQYIENLRQLYLSNIFIQFQMGR